MQVQEDLSLYSRHELENNLRKRALELESANQKLEFEIFERKQIEQDLSQREALFRDIFERAAIGIIRTGAENKEGTFFEVNDAACQFIGYTRNELSKMKIPELSHPDDLETDQKMMMKVLMGEIDYYNLEKRFIHKNGNIIWGNLTVSLVRTEKGEPRFTVATIEDISHRKAAENALNESHASLEVRVRERTHKLKDLSNKLIKAQEDERLRVSHELHDSVIQTMGISKYQVELLQKNIGLTDKTAPSTDYIIQLLSKAIEDLRQICHNLRPSVLDDLGLFPAVRGLLDEFESRSGILYELDKLSIPALSKNTELVVYRILQEVLNNVEKHAEASLVVLSGQTEANHFVFKVEDDGAGFDKEEVLVRQKNSGWGLATMSERAEAIDGSVVIDSRPGKGTQVILSVPQT